jgi:hypothetical protein
MTVCQKPKRIRRKCTHESCDNRVVQGGVCIAHGAKRKLCSVPDCDKTVKLTGYCSTRGLRRRKCTSKDCNNNAKQGGLCITHGAKRKQHLIMKQCRRRRVLGRRRRIQVVDLGKKFFEERERKDSGAPSVHEGINKN